MPRRREVPKREILPDPKFGSIDLSKFMNVIMESGKKAVAERIIYGALEQVEKKAGKDPLEVFMVALNNIKPMVEVKSRRVAGNALAQGVGPQAWREVDGGPSGERTAGSQRRPRRRDEEARRSAPHGRSQQGLLALPLLKTVPAAAFGFS